MSYEKNGLKVAVSFNTDKLKLAILDELRKGPKHGSQLKDAIVKGLIPKDFCHAEVMYILLQLEKDGMVDGDYKIIKEPTSGHVGLAGKFYKISTKQNKPS